MLISRRSFLKLGAAALATYGRWPGLARWPVAYVGPIVPNGGDISVEGGPVFYCVTGGPVWVVEMSDGSYGLWKSQP